MQNTSFINGQFMMHLNMGHKGAIKTFSYEISAPGHGLHGKKIIRQLFTPKVKGVWGKGEVSYFLEQSGKDDPEFHSISDFLCFYNLPPMKQVEEAVKAAN